VRDASEQPFEVAIVGGGPAGLAAALVLGRMRRRVLLVDADDPVHAVSEGVHGLFAHDGIAPRELRRIARDQLRPYEAVTIETAFVEDVHAGESGFSLLAGDRSHEAGVLLLATGMACELPRLAGLAELWGSAPTTVRTATAGRCAIARLPSIRAPPRTWH
jgi:thioredoxin reductase